MLPASRQSLSSSPLRHIQRIFNFGASANFQMRQGLPPGAPPASARLPAARARNTRVFTAQGGGGQAATRASGEENSLLGGFPSLHAPASPSSCGLTLLAQVGRGAARLKSPTRSRTTGTTQGCLRPAPAARAGSAPGASPRLPRGQERGRTGSRARAGRGWDPPLPSTWREGGKRSPGPPPARPNTLTSAVNSVKG